MGGVLFRDMLKAQLEDEQTPNTTLGKLLDNTWVLIGLLVVLIGAGLLFMQLNRPNPDKMFARGEELMQKPEGPAWDNAKRDHFLPLLEMDADTWEPKVEPYLKQIKAYEFKKELLGRSLTKVKEPASQPEAILRQVVELREQGYIGEARLKLEALIVVLDGNEEFAQYSELAAILLEDLPTAAENTDRYRFLKSAAVRAEKLVADGNVEEGEAVWKAIQKLIDLDAIQVITPEFGERGTRRFEDIKRSFE